MELAVLVFFLAVGALLTIRFWSNKTQISQRVRKGKGSIAQAAEDYLAGIREDERSPHVEVDGAIPVPSRRRGLAHPDIRLWMQVAVSIVILVAALLLIFLRDDADEQKWAFGTVGLILGFWLK